MIFKGFAGKKPVLSEQSFHMVGIGGIGMCGLAELLHGLGAQVTGSDLSTNANTEHLARLGIKIYVGHARENLGEASVLVYTSAVSAANPELAEARERKIPIIPRAEALAEIMRLKRGLAIAGTHGKTTTTSMATAIFVEAQAEPTVLIGGRLELIKSTALLGKGSWMIAEADESDGSFQKLSPEIAVITNIDADHLDYFKSFENLQKSFLDFALNLPFYGVCIACGDDPIVRRLFENFPKRILYYGFNEDNDYVVKGNNLRYSLTFQGEELGPYQLQVPGRHNALNGAAALISGLQAGFEFAVCARGLGRYAGVDRRMDLKGEAKGVLVYDDYGHHPTEIHATLGALHEQFPDRRLIVLFQPHRYSRTQFCWQEFIQCFSVCDVLFMTDIYPAGEGPIAGVTAERLTHEIAHKDAHYLPKDAQLVSRVGSQLKKGDLFLTLGAGDVTKFGPLVLDFLKGT